MRPTPAVRTITPMPGRDLERSQDALQPPALLLVLDLAADAGARHRRHQHQVAPGDRDVGRQRRALVADRVLGDLHHDHLPLLEQVGDRQPRPRAADRARALAPRLARSAAAAFGLARSSPSSARRRLRCGILRRLVRIAVGRGPPRALRLRAASASLVSVGVDLGGQELVEAPVLLAVGREHVGGVQEAVAALAEVDEGRADRRLEVDDAPAVDVVDQRSPGA